jgi:hypothetical protein
MAILTLIGLGGTILIIFGGFLGTYGVPLSRPKK